MLQPEWVTQRSCALECYNVNIEEEDEDAQKINILETKGYCEVQGPLTEDPNITTPLKMK